jgi:hypothetical protein
METKRVIETEDIILRAKILYMGDSKEYLVSVTENTQFGKVLEHYTETNRWSGNSRYNEMIKKYISGKPFSRIV